MPAGFFAGLAASDREALSAAQVGLSRGLPAFAKSLDDLFGRLDLETQQAFGVAEKAACSVAALSERFHAWSIDIGKLNRWVQFAKLCRDAGALGLSPIVRDILAGRLVAGSIFPAYEAAYFDALRAALFRELPELKAFDGEAQDKRVALFKQLDLMRIKLAREQIASKHAEGRPQGMPLRDSPLGVLKGEIAKKSRHLPIRKLLEKAGPAVQQLKPVFMMSPLSVAQFLKPGALEFDILLMDEASQIQPVDALGAIARAKQIVVVGDERQLPPTRFFAKLTGDDEDRDEDGPSFEAKDVESILELCLAKGAPYRLLNWHYRSKHQSLIAVSNREFYESRLFIIPQPLRRNRRNGA
ncbi:MAG: AAA domain-containing protein [Rhizomicrobium sp.]